MCINENYSYINHIITTVSSYLSLFRFDSADHYNGYLEFNDEPFDSSRLRGRPDVGKLGELKKT